MTVTITVAVTFLFFHIFSGLKSHGERIRLGAENDRNGALFILKDEKRGKRGASNGLETGEIVGFLLFFVSLFFLFFDMGWQEFFNGSSIGRELL